MIQNAAANVAPSTFARVLIVRWSPTAGPNVTANTGDVLENAGVTGPSEALSLPTFDPVYKRQIIFDKNYEFGTVASGGNPNLYTEEFDYSPGDFHLRWTTSNTNGNSTDSVGDMWTLLVVASSATAGNYPIIWWDQRVEYVDN